MRKVREVYRQGETEPFAILYEEDGRMSAASSDKEVEENLNRYFESLRNAFSFARVPQHLEELEPTIFNYASRWDHSTTFIMSEVREEKEAAAG